MFIEAGVVGAAKLALSSFGEAEAAKLDLIFLTLALTVKHLKKISKTPITIGSRLDTPFGALTALNGNKMLITAGYGTSYPGDLYIYDLNKNNYQNLKTQAQSRVYITKDSYWYFTVGTELRRQRHPEVAGEFNRVDFYYNSRKNLGI